jgi:hypothetical protein
MRLKKLIFKTSFFEDYLSFFTEVLELELLESSNESHLFQLDDSMVEILRTAPGTTYESTKLEYELNTREYKSLIQKLKFFYYRHGASRFLPVMMNDEVCQLIDPDGRVWFFSPPATINHGQEISL